MALSIRRRTLVFAALLVLAVLSVSAATTAIRQLAGPPPSITQYGYVRAISKSGGMYRVRFDPAIWLSGETASRAARADGAIGPGEPVPNDYYIRNESRRLLTYRVPRTARVTVLTNEGRGPRETRITVAELAQIVKGRNPKHRSLYDTLNSLGYWLRTTVDTVVSLQQQYQPLRLGNQAGEARERVERVQELPD